MNPQMIINSLLSKNPQLQNNPMFKNAMQMMQNNDARGLQNMAQNLAKERGVDINQLKQQIESNLRI